MTASKHNILEFRNLSVSYGGAQVVHDVSLAIPEGTIVGLVGESGCGKSTILRAAAGLLPRNARIESGHVLFNGQRAQGGLGMSYIFQDAAASLDPLFTVKNQFDEVQRYQGVSARAERTTIECDFLAEMGFSDPERVLSLHPHNLSGGMCQRVAIAMSVARDAQVLLADEPTSALDVSTQAQVLSLLARQRDDYGRAVLLVSHNIAAVAAIADTVGVMYAGHLVEFGTKDAVFTHPLHPYTRDLIAAVPHADGTLPTVPAQAAYADLALRLHKAEEGVGSVA